MELNAFGILCALAAVSFAALEARPWLSRSLVLAGFAMGALALQAGRPPQTTTGSAAIATLAIWVLLRPGWGSVRVACAGVAAAFWGAVLHRQGLAVVPAFAIAIAAPMASALLANRRPNYAPVVLCEESLLLVAAYGLILTIAPAIGEGWQSAIALRSVPLDERESEVAPWILAFGLAWLAFGAAYSIWKRR